MTQNLLYKLDKALKQNTNSNEIEAMCRDYLTKFPNNPRVLSVLNKLKIEKNNEKTLETKKLIDHHYSLNNLKQAYDLAIDLTKTISNDPSIYAALGDILRKSNNHLEAIGYYKKSYTTDNNYERLNSKLYKYLRNTKPSEFFNEWSEGFELLLSNKKILGHQKLFFIAHGALEYLKLNSDFKKIIQLSNKNYTDPDILKLMDNNVINDIKENIKILSNSILFLLSIEFTTVCDLEIEKMLTFLRKFILLNIDDLEFVEKINNLIENMALNCFSNDYIFSLTQEETIKLKELENQILLITNTQLLCIAMYKNLFNFSLNNKVNLDELPFKFSKHCILNPLREKSIINKIKSFSEINDDISIKVKEQYETFPYPLWSYTDTHLAKENITEYLSSLGLKFSNNDFFSKNIKSILLGGCGTGKEAAEYAELLPDMEITAIDLSKASLGYAIRKCEELEINNVKFLHGDILHLDKINKKFDLVLSNGVIHHMKDPAAGCEALLKRLKKNGLIKLSLYSETARSEFLKFQDEAKLQNLQSRELLRDFRNAIIRNNDIKEKWMTTISDFYNLREFKDLICHEQEHTFTIKKIQILIEKFNLEFCGFQNNFNLHEKFKDYFNSSQNLYNLDYWQEFEEKNPHIFKSMYQFWCQKNY